MKRGGKVKRMAEGGDDSEDSGFTADQVNAGASEGEKSDGPDTSQSSSDSTSSTPSTPSSTSSTPSSFGAAFKAARASGAKTFSYNGKSYTTDTKGSAPASASYSNEGKRTAESRPLKQETMSDRAESYVAKRAAARAADNAASSAKASTSAETARLAQRNPAASQKFNASNVDRNTLLPKKMAKGGSTSSASSRGDGIASKGKTRGKIC
jgi:hypothetical protein